ncbi:MAG: deoxyribodipyrimidine photo-lyase [Gammaproteobacteria bacterium]|nr:deoxyribodipyrimidine photo-lyase [Gammaproteobacteria bacterium]
MNKARLKTLNDKPVCNRRYVLYWMQQSQRVAYNHALEYAVRAARKRDQGVVVCFGVTDDYPDANLRHYDFMLRGLAEVAQDLRQRDIRFVLRYGSPPEVALQLAEVASLVVCDRGYLRHQRQWRRQLAADAPCRVIQVESDVVIPIEEVSDKQEYAARTIRKKINSRIGDHLEALSQSRPAKSTLRISLPGDGDLDATRPDSVLEKLEIDKSVGPVERFQPGYKAARKVLSSFLRARLDGYAESRNDPADPAGSTLSPYLHFGQLSPVEITRRVQDASSGSKADEEDFLEELIVRRELAANFVYHCDDYDSFRSLPDWAKKTLDEHSDDEREYVYTRKQLELGDTHDEYWNAAQREMTRTGYMHNYMRMYWGKKILEWTNTPEYAYATALYLNNKYFLDGRDPNSFANVAWLFGLHDRPWTERDIFGKVRYMNARGLERKFDIEEYVEWANAL